MNLPDTLTAIAAQLDLNASDLIAYANEDIIGGFDFDESKRVWPLGSIWAVEGQILYTLVRTLKCRRVVEIGGWAGCSGTHLATALLRNGTGVLTSVDSGIGLSDVSGAHGNRIPELLRSHVQLVAAEGALWLEAQEDQQFDLIFEDADHSAETSRRIAVAATRKLRPGGLLVVHDAMHFLVGQAIQSGLSRAGIAPQCYLTEPSDCGLAIWKAPGVWIVPDDFDTTSHFAPIEEISTPVDALDAEVRVPPGGVVQSDWPKDHVSIAPPDESHTIPIILDDLDAEVHQAVEPELYAEPAPPKKRGRKPKVTG